MTCFKRSNFFSGAMLTLSIIGTRSRSTASLMSDSGADSTTVLVTDSVLVTTGSGSAAGSGVGSTVGSGTTGSGIGIGSGAGAVIGSGIGVGLKVIEGAVSPTVGKDDSGIGSAEIGSGIGSGVGSEIGSSIGSGAATGASVGAAMVSAKTGSALVLLVMSSIAFCKSLSTVGFICPPFYLIVMLIITQIWENSIKKYDFLHPC